VPDGCNFSGAVNIRQHQHIPIKYCIQAVMPTIPRTLSNVCLFSIGVRQWRW